MSYLLVLFCLIILIFIILFIIDSRRALARTQFISLAEKLGLEKVDAPSGFLTKFPEISGKYRGHNIRIYMFTQKQGEGKSRKITINTAIEVFVDNPIAYRLDVYEEGLLSKLNKFFGMQDVIIGKEKFDKEFIIKTNDEEITKKILNDKICNELLFMANKRFGFGFEFGTKKIFYDEPKFMTNKKKSEWFERVLNILVDIAEEFEKVIKK
ncbi:MAG TPA: hypothetical protein PKW14_02165 [Bacteroidota bacterium]|jgi:hypothetical protein|nr:hypothetical protein [Bacteroidota bacterium]